VPDALERLYREVQIMRRLDHPHIVKLEEVLESANMLFLVLEYAAGGELYDLVCRRRLSETEVRELFFQVMSALMYCHRQHIIHRDLKVRRRRAPAFPLPRCGGWPRRKALTRALPFFALTVPGPVREHSPGCEPAREAGRYARRRGPRPGPAFARPHRACLPTPRARLSFVLGAGMAGQISG